jgi:hypothetical protein
MNGWLEAGSWAGPVFFEAPVADGFGEGGLEYAQFGADVRHGGSGIQHRLNFGEELIGKLGAFAARLGGEKRGRSLAAQFGAHALDGGQRHAESADDLRLGGAAVDAKLAGEHAKGGEIIHGMGEDGQMAVEIDDGVPATLEGEIRRDGGAVVREDGKWLLRHRREAWQDREENPE